MTETEKMVRAMNGFFKEMGEDELPFPTGGKPESELEMLRNVKEDTGGVCWRRFLNTGHFVLRRRYRICFSKHSGSENASDIRCRAHEPKEPSHPQPFRTEVSR